MKICSVDYQRRVLMGAHTDAGPAYDGLLRIGTSESKFLTADQRSVLENYIENDGDFMRRSEYNLQYKRTLKTKN